MLSAKMGDSIYHEGYKYEENLIKLEVFYEEFNFEVIDERPAYSVHVIVIRQSGFLMLCHTNSVKIQRLKKCKIFLKVEDLKCVNNWHIDLILTL